MAFEDFLARTSGRFATLFQTHGGWPAAALAWFHHHSEVDLQHAEEGFSHVEAFVAHHGIPDVFLARYLDWAEAAPEAGA